MKLKIGLPVFMFFTWAFAAEVFAQEWSSGLEFGKPRISPAASIGVEFNNEDVNIPVRMGAFDKQNMFNVGLEFGARPRSKNVERRFDESIVLQLQERRFLFAAYVEKYVLPVRISSTLRAGFMAGSSFGFEYTTKRGLTESDMSSLIAPYGGLSVGIKDGFLLSAGYRHDPIKGIISPHRLFFTFTGSLSGKNK